jgi:indolepyruvate ferredoxin oxidoreductase beta subunit
LPESEVRGIITGASIIARAAIAADVNAVMSEVHGMAQRGGSVVCELRLGDVHSPMIPEGEADLIMGFEPVETVRSLAKANNIPLSSPRFARSSP